MHKSILLLLTAITFVPLHGMRDALPQYPELVPELWTKIVACSELLEKDTLRQTCKTLQCISSIENWNIYSHTPLVLSHNKTKSIILLMADQKQETAINNLLSRKIDLSDAPFEFYLHLSQNYQHIAERIIQHSTIDINAPTLSGVSHLYLAAKKGEISTTVQLLCKHPKININYLYDNRFTPLYVAARNGHLGIVQLFASHPACILDGLDSQGSTPLYIACQEGKNDVVQFLLKKNVSTNKTFADGFTPLYVAARKGHVSVIKSLLNHTHTLIDKTDHEGATPLYVAAQNGHAESVKILCEYGANKNAFFFNGYPPLYIAAQNGNTEVVKALLSYSDTLINHVAPNGSTALYAAAYNGNTETVEHLLKREDIDATITHQSCSALYVATAKKYHAIMQLLLKHSPNLINLCTRKNFSPLHWSVISNDIKEITILLATPGINPNIINDDGKTPLNIAYKNKNEIIIALLTNNGAKTANEVNKNQSTEDSNNSQQTEYCIS